MSMLIFLVFWGAIAFYFYRRFKRQWARNHSPGEKFQLAPATAAGIVGLLALIPGLWILRVEGWRETWSTNLATGETTTTSTFWDQFSRAAVYFAIGGALMYASKVMAERQTPWPSPIQQQLVRLGLLPYSDPYPSAPARRQASSESQFMPHRDGQSRRTAGRRRTSGGPIRHGRRHRRDGSSGRMNHGAQTDCRAAVLALTEVPVRHPHRAMLFQGRPATEGDRGNLSRFRRL
jgi:hypothetical protein